MMGGGGEWGFSKQKRMNCFYEVGTTGFKDVNVDNGVMWYYICTYHNIYHLFIDFNFHPNSP